MRKRRKNPLTSRQSEALWASHKLGLYVMFGVDPRRGMMPPAEHWIWWDAVTGKKLLDYWPLREKYSHPRNKGQCKDWRHAMSIAFEQMKGANPCPG